MSRSRKYGAPGRQGLMVAVQTDPLRLPLPLQGWLATNHPAVLRTIRVGSADRRPGTEAVALQGCLMVACSWCAFRAWHGGSGRAGPPCRQAVP